MARIFIAIRFNDEFKEKLVAIQDSLKSRGVTGNYCSYGNLHMTLAFIGEMTNVPVPLEGNRRDERAESCLLELCPERRNPPKVQHYDLQAIREAVSEVEFEPFLLSLGTLGSFPTKAGVIWCGVKDGAPATSLACQLRERLTASGVSFSETEFYPHISLVQHPSAIITDIAVPEATIRVEKIHVMKSERIDANALWSVLLEVPLKMMRLKPGRPSAATR